MQHEITKLKHLATDLAAFQVIQTNKLHELARQARIESARHKIVVEQAE